MILIFLLVSDSIPRFEQMLTGATILSTVEGKPSWKLIADTVYDFGGEYKVYNLTVIIYDRSGLYSRIVADSGSMDKNSGNMQAFGNVIVETYDSVRLETNYLIWDDRRDRIYTPDTVVIMSGDRILRGIGFESDPSLRRIRIKRNVYGEGREGIVR